MTTATLVPDAPAQPPTPPAERKRVLPALIAGAIGFVAVAASISLASSAPPSSSGTVFPSEVATYSWFTSYGDLGMPATMVYQNGIGVEFMDSPQAVALGSDGSTYRRMGVPEQRSVPTDQGDPAAMVLSADGTFVVIAGANGHGSVVVQSLVDGTARDISVGAGRSAVPLSISSDGDRVLVIVGQGELSRYTVPPRSGTLALLELSTGDLLEYSLPGVTSAALSPDGSRVVAQSASGAIVMDADGRGIRELGSELEGQGFGDDAWSPDGTRVVTILHESEWVDTPTGRMLAGVATLHIVDVATTTTARFPIDGVEYAAALGWRDDDTVVVQGYEDDNSAQFRWVDAATGAAETFAIYESGFTGASIGSADLARDLVPDWVVEERPVDQGWVVGILAGVAVGAVVGLATWILTRRRASRPARHHEQQRGDP